MLRYRSQKEMLLDAIERRPGWSATELAFYLKLDRSNVSSMLKRMTDKGEVKRMAGEGPLGGYGYYPV